MNSLQRKSQWRPSRRTVLKGAAATAAATVVAPSVGLAAEELNILVWCDHADDKLIKPFEAAHNVKVNVKTYEGTGTALSLVEQSKPGDWDVFVIDAPDVPQVADSGLLMELPDDIAPWDDMFEEIKNSPFTRVNGKLYAAPEKFGYYGFCYNKDKIDEADARRGDLPWNSKYKGQLAVYDYYFPIIQMVGISLGLKPTDINESNLEDIRKKLLEAKPNIKLIGDIVSVQNALATGNADAIVGGAEYAVSGLMGDNPHLDWTISDQGGTDLDPGACGVQRFQAQGSCAGIRQVDPEPEGAGRAGNVGMLLGHAHERQGRTRRCDQEDAALGPAGRLPVTLGLFTVTRRRSRRSHARGMDGVPAELMPVPVPARLPEPANHAADG